MDQRPKTIKRLEENIGQQLQDIGLDNDFLEMISRHRPQKKKIDKLDPINIKNFCTSKETIYRVNI